jgi:hypothetical protein
MTIADQLYQWALLFAGALYGYEQPPEPPTVAIVTHEFLVDRACGGVECKVLGWYNDEGIVYLDESIARRIETNALAQSILVHEFVHYLQHVSGRYPAGQCEVFVEREREAYAVSDTFLTNNGWVAGPHTGAFGTCAAGGE